VIQSPFAGITGLRPACGSPPIIPRAIEHSAAACSSFPAGNVAGYKENYMTTHRKLAVRSDRGHIVAPAETFSTQFMQPNKDGYTSVNDEAIVEAALGILAKRVSHGSVLSSPKTVKDYLVTRLADLEYEIFGLMLLTTRHRLIDCVDLFRGTLAGASVSPREVVKLTLQMNSAAVIAYHNHPSGQATPSQADELITSHLKSALALVEVRLIDHIVIATGGTFSFAESGLL
jgi:DNA repair protein RadC